MNTQEQPRREVNPAVVFMRLIGRAANGLPFTKNARCPVCQRVTKHGLVAETESTHESIYACEACGQMQAL